MAILVPATSVPLTVASVAAATSSAALPGSTAARLKITVIGTQDFYIKFGVTGLNAADATNIRVPANVPTTFVLDTSQRFFSLVRVSADGIVQIFQAY